MKNNCLVKSERSMRMMGENNPNYRHGPKYCKGCGKELSRNTKGKRCSICIFQAEDYKNPFAGKSHTTETRARMSKNHADISGSKNPFFGKSHTDDFKKRLKVIRKQIWEKGSPEFKKKITDALLRGIATQRKGDYTNPEMIVAEELDKMEIDFNHNTPLYEKFLVDFLLPDGTVIEVFGDYWHGNRDVFASLTDTQKKQQGKDRSRIAYLEKCGHRVVIIWEKELKEDKGIVWKRLFKVRIEENKQKGR